jgi:UDP-2,3-diacylglucosamine pyrophosphatase LpxH
MTSSKRYRTIFLSDAHLGIRESKAEFLLDFLKQHDADRYYLVGDIFDGWALQRSWYWPESHNTIIQMLLEKAQDASMTYIPGNHDEAARRFPGLRLGDITIKKQAMHTTVDGRRFLVLHGDEFDGVVRHARWLSMLGAWAYTGILKLNHQVNRVRRWMKLPYWSLSAYLKHRTKQAVQFIANFENAVAKRAEIQDADGVICGHIHHPEMRVINGVQYVNTGDWVESCTALVEHYDGTLEILRWVPDAHGAQTSVARGFSVSGDGQAVDAPVLATSRVQPS